ncbi:UNVERIFIED_CONTAM: protein Brevis radix-like 4 [Sesamum calycinum]|uniref:Protein Brevis radix-like 4 n=1 Tax=Sesamum calycinum TaxID=2727403 RepID=A0AAW2N406_9LAMI
MLTCIARSKQPSEGSSSIDHLPPENSTPMIKDMALKASGAYRHCAPCANQPAAQQRSSGSDDVGESDAALALDKFRWSYRRTGSSSSNSSSTAGRRELEARLKGISSGEGTPASASGRRVDPVVFVEESEPKEWVAQVEPGVLITFVSLPRGGNDLKRIRFSRDMFNKWQAQRWWAENCDKVMELYNVQRLNRQAFPVPSTPRSEDDSSSKMESIEDSPVTPPLGRERLPRTLYRPTGTGMEYSSSDSFDHQSMHSRSNYDSCGVASTPKLSSISGAKTETSSMDASMRTSSSRDAGEYPSMPVIWKPNGSNRMNPVCTLPSGLWRTVDENSDVSDSAGRSLGRCMQEYGGKRIEQGYINSTCDWIEQEMNRDALL